MLSQTPHGHPGSEARTCSACGKMARGLGGGTGAGSGGGLFYRSLLPFCSIQNERGIKGRERKENPRKPLPLSRAATKTFGYQPAYLSPRLLSGLVVAQVKAPEFRSPESTQTPGRHRGPPVQDTASSEQAGRQDSPHPQIVELT